MIGKLIMQLNRIRISTTLLIVMSQFLLVLVVLGGTAYYFLNQNGVILQELDEQNQQQNQVMGFMATASEVRAGLLLSAYQMRESYYSGDLDLERTAQERVQRLKAVMQEAEKQYETFYLAQSKEPGEVTALIDALHNSYEPYLHHAIYPLIEALEEHDYQRFYSINEREGNSLAESFEANLQNLTKSSQVRIDNSLQLAQDGIDIALTIILVGLGMGLLFTFITRFLFSRYVVTPLRDLGTHFSRIASGDLSHYVHFDASNEIGVLYNSANRMQTGLQAMVCQVRDSAFMIQNSALDIFAGNTELTTRMEQTSSALQETAATMGELATTVRLNTNNAVEADNVTKQSASIAQKGGSAVCTVVDTMGEIEKSSAQITGFVNVIDSIAFQTNILALNAAVEAARAGEQGRGFAVVASEVRALAQRSAQAASEVKGLMESSAVRVNAGAKQASEAGQVIDEVVQSINSASHLMSDIAQASNEQADGIVQVNVAVSQMDTVVQRNMELVEQLAGLAGTLQDHAEQLNNAMAQFQVDDGQGEPYDRHDERPYMMATPHLSY